MPTPHRRGYKAVYRGGSKPERVAGFIRLPVTCRVAFWSATIFRLYGNHTKWLSDKWFRPKVYSSNNLHASSNDCFVTLTT